MSRHISQPPIIEETSYQADAMHSRPQGLRFYLPEARQTTHLQPRHYGLTNMQTVVFRLIFTAMFLSYQWVLIISRMSSLISNVIVFRTKTITIDITQDKWKLSITCWHHHRLSSLTRLGWGTIRTIVVLCMAMSVWPGFLVVMMILSSPDASLSNVHQLSQSHLQVAWRFWKRIGFGAGRMTCVK